MSQLKLIDIDCWIVGHSDETLASINIDNRLSIACIRWSVGSRPPSHPTKLVLTLSNSPIVLLFFYHHSYDSDEESGNSIDCRLERNRHRVMRNIIIVFILLNVSMSESSESNDSMMLTSQMTGHFTRFAPFTAPFGFGLLNRINWPTCIHITLLDGQHMDSIHLHPDLHSCIRSVILVVQSYGLNIQSICSLDSSVQ